jgi:hypothetical protein
LIFSIRAHFSREKRKGRKDGRTEGRKGGREGGTSEGRTGVKYLIDIRTPDDVDTKCAPASLQSISLPLSWSSVVYVNAVDAV